MDSCDYKIWAISLLAEEVLPSHGHYSLGLVN
jgi:hypothetical protein